MKTINKTEFEKLKNEFLDGTISEYNSDFLQSILKQNKEYNKDFTLDILAIEKFKEYSKTGELELNVEQLISDINPYLGKSRINAVKNTVVNFKDSMSTFFNNYSFVRYAAAILIIAFLNILIIGFVIQPNQTINQSFTSVYTSDSMKVFYDKNRYKVEEPNKDESLSIITGLNKDTIKDNMNEEKTAGLIDIKMDDIDT